MNTQRSPAPTPDADAIRKALEAPFPLADLEFRIGRCGKSNGKVWARCFTYVTNRAIMARLDDVFGPGNWANEFRQSPGQKAGVLCGIGIRATCLDDNAIPGEFVWRWDGAEQTQMEAVKGGLSSAMKRAAVQWGIGRYLYDLEEGFATVFHKKMQGLHYGKLPAKEGGDVFYWRPAPIPDKFLPENERGKQEEVQQTRGVEHRPEERVNREAMPECRSTKKQAALGKKKLGVFRDQLQGCTTQDEWKACADEIGALQAEMHPREREWLKALAKEVLADIKAGKGFAGVPEDAWGL